MKHLLNTRLAAVALAYAAGSYAYSFVFMLRIGAEWAPFQIVLLFLSPLWLLFHMPLVLLCSFGHGHGSWNADNTVSSIAFGCAFLAAYVGIEAYRKRYQIEQNQALHATSESAPSANSSPHDG